MLGYMGDTYNLYSELAAVEDKPCSTATSLRWCAVQGKERDGVTELEKCQSMVPYLNAANNQLSWSCVERSDCHGTALEEGNADLVALDGGDLFAASRLWDAMPVLAEDYNAQQASGECYVSGVVRSDRANNQCLWKCVSRCWCT